MTIRKRYKIKEFSEEMGVTVDLVKHYEKYGIINPIKEQDCKYRFYTIQHGERILASKRFRNMGFTIRDSAKIMNEYSLEEIQATLDNKAKDIEKEIRKLNSINKRVIELKEQCELFKECENKIAIMISPGFYFLRQTENAEFDQDEITKERIKEWIEYFPFVTKALKVPKDYFTNEKSINYQWGLVIGEDTANNIGINCTYPVEYIKPQKCYRYVVAKPYNGSSIEALEEVVNEVKRKKLKVVGDMFLEAGIDSFNKKINCREVHYIFWIPIQ